MYPNPSSGMVHGSEHLRLFEFLGRILGKALYEGITVSTRTAGKTGGERGACAPHSTTHPLSSPTAFVSPVPQTCPTNMLCCS